MLALLATLMVDAAAAELPVKPLSRPQPNYPYSCAPPVGEVPAPQSVIVAYSVKSDGLVEAPRVRETSNSCFNDAALTTVRQWVFERHNARDPIDLETTIRFRFDDIAEVNDLDARPKKRVPPKYPSKCFSGARDYEAVVVEFDVTASGEVENERVLESTYECVNEASLDSVRQWKFDPKIVDSARVSRSGVRVRLAFELTDDRAYTPSIRKALSKVGAGISQGQAAAESLKELSLVEEEYGAKFSSAERSTFFRLRGAAHLAAGSYREALDDLKAARQTGVMGDAAKSMAEMIRKLEAYIAAEDAAAAASTSKAGAATENED